MSNKEDWEITHNPKYIEETIETAGCTGQCQFFKGGLPHCEKCSNFTIGREKNMKDEKIANELVKHIQLVEFYLRQLTGEANRRGARHDESKWSEEEWDLFLEYTPKLKNCTYGSSEYNQYLKELKPALDHHYQCNRHHPEHHIGYHSGIKGMNLVDIMEMLCDWLASTKRHVDGDIFKSIEINQKRFGYSDDVKAILSRTAEFLVRCDRIEEIQKRKRNDESIEKFNYYNY